MIILNQQNTFVSQVERPRREAMPLSSSRGGHPGTTTSMSRSLLEDHILLGALRMHRTFCFLDFPGMEPNQFKKAVLRLRRRGLITAKEPRSCPRFYQITPKFLLQLVPENTRVGHLGPGPDLGSFEETALMNGSL